MDLHVFVIQSTCSEESWKAETSQEIHLNSFLRKTFLSLKSLV